MRVLIIDDARTMRAMLKKIVLGMGFESFEAQDGAEGLQRLKELGPVDIILVDWNMPVMNGFEFICFARDEPAYAKIPIIVITTEIETANVTKALEAGANEYVMKPFTEDVIVEKIKSLGLSGRLL
jgi:two-component system chemotaxis response regulator CheY